MGWSATLTGLLASILLGLWARAGIAQPAEPGRVRYVPYTLILFATVIAASVMLGQLVKLAVSP